MEVEEINIIITIHLKMVIMVLMIAGKTLHALQFLVRRRILIT